MTRVLIITHFHFLVVVLVANWGIFVPGVHNCNSTVEITHHL